MKPESFELELEKIGLRDFIYHYQGNFGQVILHLISKIENGKINSTEFDSSLREACAKYSPAIRFGCSRMDETDGLIIEQWLCQIEALSFSEISNDPTGVYGSVVAGRSKLNTLNFK